MRRWHSPTGRASCMRGSTAPGIRRRTRCSPRAPRSRPATPCARSRHATTCSDGSSSPTTPGSTSVARPCSASSRASSAASTMPSRTSAGRQRPQGRLGFLQTEAYQLTSLGRAQCQAGDHASGAATLAAGIAKAEATGDVRLAALGRVHLGRILRALGRGAEARTALEAAAAFHRAAGGGEQDLLGDTLLAALDRGPRRAVRRYSSERGATATPPPRCSRSTRWRSLTGDDRSRRGGRRAHGARLALHHAARPGRPPRWLSSVKASRPAITIVMPAICRPLITSPRSRNDHTTASAG